MTGRRRALFWTLPLCLAGGLLPGAGFSTETAAQAVVSGVEGPLKERAAVGWREIGTVGGATRIRLDATPQPKYRLYTSEESSLIELELFDVTLEGLPAKVDVGDGTVETVEARALPGGVGRLSIRLAGPGAAEVAPWEKGLDVLVRLTGSEAGVSIPTSPAQRVARPLEGRPGLAFSTGAAPSNLSAFQLSEKTLVVDAEGGRLPKGQVLEELAEGPIARVRLARLDGSVRAVVEAREAGAFEGYGLEKTKDGFLLTLAEKGAASAQGPAAASPSKPAGATVTSGSSASAATKPKPAAPEAQPVGGGEVVDLGFRQEEGKSLVEVALSKAAPHAVRESSPRRVVVDLLRTSLPNKFRRALDTSAFSGPVRMVAAYPRRGGADTRLVVDLARATPYRIEREGARIVLAFEGGAEPGPVPGVAAVEKVGDEVVVVEGKPAAEKAERAEKAVRAGAPAPAGRGPAGPVYTGRRLSMDFVDADIRNVLRLIGEVSGLNLVAGDDVQGKVSVRLVDVPWDQALGVILKTKGLDQVREGNVIRIAPADKLAAEKAKILEAEKASEDKAPLVSDILPVNYATASELLDKVKAVLTTRGTVAVDQRTNAVIVKDVAEKIQEAKALIARLDTPTPQVLIEARIVEVSSTYSKDLGIQWGGQYTANTAHGNATGWAFPNSIGVQGATGTGGNYAVNFPAAVAAGSPGGALAVTLGHVNDILTLDLRLSALESSGHGRVVSSPRVATLDNRTAEISQGISIPFTTSTEEKIETQSIDYLLKLNVTPHVTADRSIMMKIDLKKDNPSSTFKAVDTKTPAKETRAATTEVLVKDGETTVIGGIITEDKSNTQEGIPFLSGIPVLGALFRHKLDNTSKTELIIFITPKIANLAPVAGNP